MEKTKCEVCNYERDTQDVTKRRACASDECCYQFVCADCCWFSCSKCNEINEVCCAYSSGKTETFVCINCSEHNKISLEWWGISDKEYERRL